jgi:hypothetical protein
VRSRGPLGLSLSAGGLGAGSVGAVGILVSALAAGRHGALSASCGVTVVVLFFVVSLYLVEVANRVSPSLTLPVGLTVYSTLILWLGVVAFSSDLPDKLDPGAFSWSAIAATLGWVVVQAVAVWRQRIPYVDVELPTHSADDDAHLSAARSVTDRRS